MVDELPVDIDGTLVLSKEEGVIKTVMVYPMGELELEGLTIVDGNSKVEFEGDEYNGFFIVQDTEFVMKAKRVK